MTLERKLIEKKYFEGYIKDRNEIPIEVLGKLYIGEQSKNVPDLTSIRFAQGELYFHYQDYETAIFKWENIGNELEPWAKKNLADAYMQLGELSTAEGIYKSVLSESELLNVEISLQLFALYIEKANFEMAHATIKNLIVSHPDYNNMTTLARSYFEEQKNWDDAIELAVSEGMRTESLTWYKALIEYADLGLTCKYEPLYFLTSLKNVQQLDHLLFEQFALALWKSYRKTAYYLDWLKEFNLLLHEVIKEEPASWTDMPSVLGETYMHLIAGAYSIKEIEGIIPSILSNFLSASDEQLSIVAAASILAWNDMFPSTIESHYIDASESLVNEISESEVDLEDILRLFERVLEWADQHDIKIDKMFAKKVLACIPSTAHHLFIVGAPGSGVNEYINELIGQTILAEEIRSLLSIKDDDYLEIKEITVEDEDIIENLSDFYNEQLSSNRENDQVRAYELSVPSKYLHENNWIVTTAPFNNSDQYLEYGLLADSLIYVINEKSLFSNNEYEKLIEIQEKVPQLTIQFLVYIDEVDNEKVAAKRLQKVTTTIQHYFPASEITMYAKHGEKSVQLNKISRFYQEHFAARNIQEERMAKSIMVTQDIITNLLDKRIDMEESLKITLGMHEEMVSKLKGAKNQLNDVVAEKSQIITEGFESLKENAVEEIKEEIPKLLRSCKDIIKEECDFGKIHILLNDEMNIRINSYVNQTLLPNLYNKISEWIERSKEEFMKSQQDLDELCDGFNSLYEKNHLQLTGEYSLLEDWQRDAHRMTSGVRMDKMNILLRFKPSQVLLKSAGKIFGNIPQNKKLLHSKYHKYLETEDFSEAVANIVETLIAPFDFFEKGIDRDVRMFFYPPQNVLEKTIEENSKEIQEYKEVLEKLKNNPEMFHDPLRLFELRLLQYDWLANTQKPAIAGSFQEKH
ncbi:lipopolysaccharide assembly protein LapB [Niallia sp. NCCP-28]|uniref:tetratricopeptide repeat protein n=1 Tax=Niallia sp. NCCP-28 TaxID=2934712 RepID=UPI00208D609B|nr:GTP-binding protein [Niallia sp. NCCP-28]GKU84466.1 GTP-binding protein [Niallia sp. NCCP-28]